MNLELELEIQDAFKSVPKEQHEAFAKHIMRMFYEERLMAFAGDICGYKDVNEETHWDVVNVLRSPLRKRLIIMPRGTLKSSIACVAYVIWRLTKDPNLRILIDSQLFTNSATFLYEIKQHVATDEYKNLWPEHKWHVTEGEATLTNRTKRLKEASITCGGVGTVKVGQHYDIEICDDYNSDKNSSTTEGQQKVIRHFQMNSSILEPEGEINIIATRYAELDIPGFIQKNELELREFPYGRYDKGEWAIVYKRAIEPDGKLLFPQKLTKSVLEGFRKTMGSYLYANQYLNEVIPDDAKTFKPEWLRRWTTIPERIYTFIAIDPALSEQHSSDSTGIAVVSVAEDGNRYVRYAERKRCSPTDLVNLVFQLFDIWKPVAIGIETVAYQKAIMYFLALEMRKRGLALPIAEIKHGPDKTKDMRILSLVPWLEWGQMYLPPQTTNLDDELLKFPRGASDDIIDALAMANEIAYGPTPIVKSDRPSAVDTSKYEQWYIKQMGKGSKPERYDPET